MHNKKTVEAIFDFINTAEKSIKNAKKLLQSIIDENGVHLEKTVDLDTAGLNSYQSGDSKIVEGVFTGKNMLGVDGIKYPVPANYASKSKIVQGDKLKLTVTPNGKMLYKQIEPIERESKVGLVIKEKDTYQVVIWENTYNLLTAAVTHEKVNIWDTVSVILPANKTATFAALDVKM